MLKIGEFSKLSRVSIRMLRYYDEVGLLKPMLIDPDSAYRYYSEDQLAVAWRIKALKDMGFALSAIGEMIADYGDKAALMEHMRKKQAELAEELAQTEYRLRLLDTAIERLRKDETMKYDVTLKTFPERYAATVRMTIPSYYDEGRLWHYLMKETKDMQLVEDDPCYCCAVFHNGEYKENDVDVEVQKTVKGKYADTEHVRFRTLPAVTAATTIHKGAYDGMGEAMTTLAKWVNDNGYEFEGPAFDVYHVSPHETSDPNELVTEICYPVKKK